MPTEGSGMASHPNPPGWTPAGVSLQGYQQHEGSLIIHAKALLDLWDLFSSASTTGGSLWNY